MAKIAVLTSGGVDSSVVLNLLKNQGHDVTAFYIKIWLEDEFHFLGECPWQEDLDYVKAVTDKLNVPLQIISLQHDYWDKVISYALDEVKAGRTPNPDMLCNSKIKFGEFFNYIDSSFDFVASGHYADKETVDGIDYLKLNPDPVKDQTYFLGRLTPEQLKRIIFPIGQLTKKEIRELANKFDLPNKSRKDSQGICFLGKISYNTFIKCHLGEKTGDIIDYDTNTVIGKHSGYWFYTLGQRKGLYLSNGPWFVVKKDIENNIIYVSKNYYAEDKARNQFVINNLHWISRKPNPEDNIRVRIRHGGTLYKAKLTFEGEQIKIDIDSNDQGIAPGQFAVLYADNFVLGSGVIS